MKVVSHYKPNLIYEILIHDTYHYVGCHVTSKEYLNESSILNSSGNYLCLQIGKTITRKEYRDSVRLLWIKEFDSREEALENEILAIQECREKYGDLCKNIAFGNKLGNRGVSYSEEYKQQMSERMKGAVFSEEHKKKIGEAIRGLHKMSKEGRERLSEYHKGKHWYNNGLQQVLAFECPEGFWPGRARSQGFME